MKRMLKMLRDDDGAVTVDWVVLTAAVVMLGMLIAPMLKSPVSNLAEAIGDGVEEALVERDLGVHAAELLDDGRGVRRLRGLGAGRGAGL